MDTGSNFIQTKSIYSESTKLVIFLDVVFCIISTELTNWILFSGILKAGKYPVI